MSQILEKSRKPLKITIPLSSLKGREVGLGDILKEGFRRLGIKPCAGCEDRAEFLNKWIVVEGESEPQ